MRSDDALVKSRLGIDISNAVTAGCPGTATVTSTAGMEGRGCIETSLLDLLRLLTAYAVRLSPSHPPAVHVPVHASGSSSTTPECSSSSSSQRAVRDQVLSECASFCLGVRAIRASDTMGGSSAQGQVDAKGVFKIENIAPDTMSLRVMGTEPTAYAQSVRLDGQDVDLDAVPIKPGEGGQLEVTIAANGGSVEGTVRLANDAEHEGAAIALWPNVEPTAPLKPSLVRIIRTGPKVPALYSRRHADPHPRRSR